MDIFTITLQDGLPSLLLGLVILLVIIGNTLVVAAVSTSRKLRTVTNIFIVNLACADLLLGLLILPFSAVLEIMDTWIFGHIWCQIWLALDVWLCTVSILTLCCISMDRYLAITRPIRYPGILSSRRAKTLVAGVWLFSFIIGCPPLIGWNDFTASTPFLNKTEVYMETTVSYETGDVNGFDDISYFFCVDFENFTIWDNTSCIEREPAFTATTCELTNTRSYRVYAALGSFFIPMLVTVFFYLQIYRAAVRTIAAYEKGELKTKYSTRDSNTSSKGNNSVTLRVHRGGGGFGSSGGSVGGGGGRGCNYSGTTTPTGIGTGTRNHRTITKSKSSDASLATFGDLSPNERLGNGNSLQFASPDNRRRQCSSQRWQKDRCRHDGNENRIYKCGQRSGGCSATSPSTGRGTRGISEESGGEGSSGEKKTRNKQREHQIAGHHHSFPLSTSTSSPTFDSGSQYSRGLTNVDRSKRPRFSLQKPAHAMKLHMQKFNREKKAAKTLAIIVGAFILCWLPFFTIYLVGAFCENCIPPMVFSVAFWLGYCNSAMNPCVYAFFSRDFRFAFRKLLTCKTWKRHQGFRPQTSDVPAIQLHCPPQDEARSSSDIEGSNWR